MYITVNMAFVSYIMEMPELDTTNLILALATNEQTYHENAKLWHYHWLSYVWT